MLRHKIRNEYLDWLADREQRKVARDELAKDVEATISILLQVLQTPKLPGRRDFHNNKQQLTTTSTHQRDRTLSLCDDVRSKKR